VNSMRTEPSSTSIPNYKKCTTYMKKVKITILKTTLNEELAREYGAVGIKACPMMKEGDVFMADSVSPL